MGAINFRMPDELHDRLTNQAKENGRSLNSEILHCINQSLGEIGSVPTLVHSEELGDMLFLPSGKISDVTSRIFQRFCNGISPIGSSHWDKEFSSLSEAAETSGDVVARLMPAGLVIDDHALWHELYRKYIVIK